jgi:FtsZ-binding cell division protein ZapB
MELDTNKLQISVEKGLLTMQEIANMIGKSVATVSNMLREFGQEPVVESQNLGDLNGKTPALYDFRIFNENYKVKNAKIEEKKAIALQKTVDSLSPIEKGAVIRNGIQELDDDHSPEAVDAKIANAMGFMGMLAKELEYQKNKNVALEQSNETLEANNNLLEYENDNLKTELDLSETKMTVETFAIRKGKPISRKDAASVTRRLHKAGYIDLGKIPSKYDNNMPATLWHKDHLQFAYSQGWFYNNEETQ